MRRTTLINLLCGALLAGLVLGRFGLSIPGLVVVIALAAGLWLAWRFPRCGRPLLLLALVGLGMWRVAADAAEQARLTSLVGQKLALTGTISDDPAFDARGFLTFHVTGLRAGNQALPGEIKVQLYQTNLHRGYTVAVAGTLKPPYYAGPPEMSYPQLTVLSRHQSWLEQQRQHFFAGLRTALPEPLASFGLGLLVGVRALIPRPLQQELTLVGLSHLVAVSGYNLTIIVGATHRLLERFGRGIALVTSLWFIGAFLVVTGASASIVRASLVAVLVLLAAYYGRRFQPLVIILVTAAITAVVKPGYLTDYGWLLSYLAFFGIMIVAPAVEARLGHPRRLLTRLLIETSAAQAMTIPLLLFSFGDLSVVAPVTNLIELPLVPLAMLASFIAGLAGMALPAFAGWLAWPAALLLGFMLDLVHWTAGWPWAATTFRIDVWAMLAMYTLILFATLALGHVNRRRGNQPAGPLAIMS